MVDHEKKKFKYLYSGVIWLFFSIVITGILIPVLSIIWKDNTYKHIVAESKLLADDVLRKYEVDSERNKKFDDFMRVFYFDLNALAGWGHVYGTTDKEELDDLQEWSEFTPELSVQDLSEFLKNRPIRFT